MNPFFDSLPSTTSYTYALPDWITMNYLFFTALPPCCLESHIHSPPATRLNHSSTYEPPFFQHNVRTHICMIESLWIFLTALEHIYAWLNHYEFFFTMLKNTYMHDWIFFDSLRTHICMIESLWNFFDNLRTNRFMIELLWKFFDRLRTHISVIESLWIFFDNLRTHIYAWLNHYEIFWQH